MERLNDDCLLMVFKLVNLNDRASLRAVNKRFKAVCDNIPIKKLIMMERVSGAAGKLFHTEEAYGYEDTASFYDLQKLFDNQTLLKQMKYLRVLVIYGIRLPAPQFDLDVKFDQLEYLLLSQLILHSPKILQSSQIKHLILEQVYMKDVDELNARMKQLTITGAGETLSVHAFGFDNLRASGLKYLRLKPKKPLEFGFFDFCTKNKLFNSLDELEVTFDDFKSLLLLSERCPNIKVITAVTPDLYLLFDLFEKTDLPDFFRRMRKDLKLYLFGIEFNQSTAKAMPEFLVKFGGSNMRVNCSNLDIMIERPLYKKILEFGKKHDLTRFYRLVNEVYFSDQIKDPKFCKNFVNCETVRFDLGVEPESDFANYYDYFPNKKCVKIEIHGLREIQLSNAFLNEIPKRCPRLFVLILDSKNKALKFDFLFKLKDLITIVLNTHFPFDESVYIELLQRMKHLFRLDVRWVSESVDRNQLSTFKKRVIKCLAEKKSSDLEFRVNIHKKETKSFVRYHVLPKALNNAIIVDPLEEDKLYAWSMVMNMKAQFPGRNFSVLRGPLSN